MNLIDTHCHLYLPEFDSDRQSMITRARDAGITKFFLPNIEAASIEPMLSLAAAYPGQCYPMMGLHPCSVKENWEEEISVIKNSLFEQKTVTFRGIGETGLDYYWDKSFISSQKENFQMHIEWAKELRLPVIIHSRDATADCIEMIRKNKDENLTGIFHCFSGTFEQARQITELGFYLGIGGVVTFKNGGLDKVVEKLDLNTIVLETDSPYLAPVPFRGKRNESSYLKLVLDKVASLMQLNPGDVMAATSANAEKVFQL